MITIYDLKPRFQNLLRPLVQAMAKAGVSANAVTLFAVFVSIAAGAALFLSKGAVWALFCIPVVLFLRMALNAIDGMLAKEHAMKSDLGALLNEMGGCRFRCGFIPSVCAYRRYRSSLGGFIRSGCHFYRDDRRACGNASKGEGV